MALEVVAGIAVHAAFGYLKDQKFFQQALGKAGTAAADAAINVADHRAGELLAHRLRRDSPFANRRLGTALRRAYLAAVQFTSVECRRRAPARMLDADLPSWLDALNRAIAYEMRLTEKKDYLPPDSTLGQNIPVVMIEPDPSGGPGAASRLETALIAELEAELSAPEKAIAEKTSPLADRLYDNLAKAASAPGIPAPFDDMIVNGWIDEEHGAPSASGWKSHTHELRVRWLDLIHGFFANALSQDQQLSQLFFREILCRLAAGQGAHQTLEAGAFLQSIDERVGGLRAYFGRFEVQLQDLERRLDDDRQESASQGRQLDHVQGELTGLRTLLEAREDRVMTALSTIGAASSAAEGYAAGASAGTARIERKLEIVEALLKRRIEERSSGTAPRFSPERHEGILRAYLAWLERELRFVPGGVVVGGRRLELPLDQVYVSLRGYPAPAADMRQARSARQRTARYEEPLALQERDASAQFAKVFAESVDLGQAFRDHRAMVVLGDPGSGKTTLSRWLALVAARAFGRGPARLRVAAKLVDTSAPRPDEPVELGPAHLPIFLRIADVEKEYARRRGATLEELLGAGESIGRPVYLAGPERGEKVDPADLAEFLRGYVKRQQAIVFLDGLDELADPNDRKTMVSLIHRFLDEHFPEDPADGNRLVVTSRVIGYELHPLRDSVSKFTIERLKDDSIRSFSDAWHRAYFTQAGGSDTAAAARAASEAFRAQVLNPSRGAVRDLATNPLLLSLLCVVNQEHGQSLPESRAHLYRLIVGRGLRSLFIDRKPEHRAVEEKIKRALCAIATRIHSTTSSGVLGARELRQIVAETMGGEQDEVVRQHFQMVVEGTGLLSERGDLSEQSDRQYGFRHQTIQEYLAGLELIEEPATASARLLEKCADPRWREAVLLGLGELSESEKIPAATFVQTCRELLASRSGIFPVGAILLAQAVRDFAALPAEVIEEMAEALLSAYGLHETLEERAFGSFVEDTIAHLLRSNSIGPDWRRAAEKAIDRFVGGSMENVQTLSLLIQRRGLYLEAFAEPLLAACRLETGATNWPVHEALEKMATSRSLEPAPLEPVTPAVIARLKPETITTLKNTAVVESVRYLKAGEDSGIAACSFPSFLLPMRELLERDPALLERVRRDALWLAALTPIYGGFGNYDTARLRMELREGRAKIGSEAIDDMVEGRIAAHLDARFQLALDKAKRAGTEFRAEFIFCDSPLTPVLSQALVNGRPALDGVEDLRQLWAEPEGYAVATLAAAFRQAPAGRLCDEERATVLLLCDVLLVLAAIGGPESHPALEEPPSELQRKAIAAFREEAGRIRRQQQEILFRSKSAFENFLTASAPEAGPQPVAAPEPVTLPAQSSTWDPEGTAWEPIPEGAERSSHLGRLWLGLIDPNDSRASHRLAVVLDAYGKELTKDPLALSASWMHLNTDRHSKWPHPRRGDAFFRDRAGAPAPAKDLYSLAGIDAIPHGFDFLKVFALRHVAGELAQAPTLRPLLVGLALPLADRPRDFAIAVLKFGGGELNPELLRARAMQEAVEITDPLLRFWSCRYLTGAHQAASEEWRRGLLDAALEIADAECRGDALAAFAALFAGTAEAGEAQRRLTGLTHGAAPIVESELPRLDETDTAILAFASLIERRGSSLLSPQSLISARPKGHRARLLMLSFKQALLEENDDRVYSLSVRLDTSGKFLGDSIGDLIEALAESVGYAVEAGWDQQRLAAPIAQGHPHNLLLQALTFLAMLPPDSEALVAWALKKLNPYLTANARDLLGIANLIGAGAGDRYRPLCMPPELVSLTGLEIAERTARRLSQMEDPWIWFHTARFLRKWAGDVISAVSQIEAALVIPPGFGRLEALQLTFFENAEALLIDSDVAGILRRLRECVPPGEFRLLQLVWGLALPAELRHEIGVFGSDDLAVVLGGEEHAETAPCPAAGPIEWLERRLPSIVEPAAAAAVASVAVGLRLDAVVPERKEGLSLASLLNQRSDAAAWRIELSGALAAGIHMTAKDAHAVLQALRAADSTKRVEQLLPFVRSHDRQAMTAVQEWAGSRKQGLIGKWASIMLAEEGHWNPKVVSVLLEMVQSPNDLLRNRAWMQLAGGNFRSASRLRLPVLLALAQGRSHPAPQVSLASAWAFESILYDDPGVVRQCVERVESRAPGFEFAGMVLRAIKQPSPRVVIEMLGSLSATQDVLVQRELLKGFICSWTGRLKRYPDSHPSVQQARELIERLRTSDNAEVANMAYEALGFFADQPALDACFARALQPGRSQAGDLHALAIAAEERGPEVRMSLAPGGPYARLDETLDSVDPEVAVAAGELFLRAGFPVEGIRDRLISDDVFVRACAASLDKFFADDHFRIRLARLGKAIGSMAARHVDQRGYDSLDPLSTALRRLKSSLEATWTSGLEGPHGDRLANLLPLCAAAAEVMPDLYRRIAETLGKGFAARLQIAAARVHSFPARQAALTLLALTRAFSRAFAQAILPASTDVHPVQRTLLTCVDRFREIDDDAVADLNRLLGNASANVAYFATRVVLAIVSNENLPPQRREHCRVLGVNALTAAIDKATPFPVVSIIERGEDDWTPRVRQVGLLRDLLREALVTLSSIDLSDQKHDRGDGCAVLRFHSESETGPRSFDVRIADRAPEDPIPNQRLWLQADFRVQVPFELGNALSDVRAVAEQSRVSCAELLDQARRDTQIL